MTNESKLEALKAKETDLFAQLANKSLLDYEIVRLDRACADVRKQMDAIRTTIASEMEANTEIGHNQHAIFAFLDELVTGTSLVWVPDGCAGRYIGNRRIIWADGYAASPRSLNDDDLANIRLQTPEEARDEALAAVRRHLPLLRDTEARFAA
jgi:hypothetical protein